MLLAPYAVALGLIVWLPADQAQPATGVVLTIAHAVSGLTGMDLTTSYAVLEFLANIVLFAPLGLLVAVAWPQSRAWRVILLGCAVSVLIEVVQTLLPSRVPTPADVAANTLGAGAGYLAAWLLIIRGLAARHP